MTFKIDLRPGTKLSEHFNNRRDCYKVVETDYILGYEVLGGGRDNAAAVYPLYRADIHIKAGKTWHIVSSYDKGDRLNDYTFHTDYEGCTFATIVSQAVNALVERKHVQERLAAKPKPTKPAKKRRSR